MADVKNNGQIIIIIPLGTRRIYQKPVVFVRHRPIEATLKNKKSGVPRDIECSNFNFGVTQNFIKV